MHLRTIAIILCCATAFALSGCGTVTDFFSFGDDEVVLAPHNAVSTHNYKIARIYCTEGRYELAKEHYLLAYAAAGDDIHLRDTLAKEIEAVDAMIKTLR